MEHTEQVKRLEGIRICAHKGSIQMVVRGSLGIHGIPYIECNLCGGAWRVDLITLTLEQVIL